MSASDPKRTFEALDASLQQAPILEVLAVTGIGSIGYRVSRLRAQLNEQLMLCGLRVEEDGSLSKTEGLDDEQIGLLWNMFRLIGLGWLVGG